MGTLYEMTAQGAQLYELLQAEEIDEQTFADTLEAIGSTEKVEAYCQIIQQMMHDAEMYKAEIDRVTEKKRKAEAGVERMKSALLAFLTCTGQKKVEAGTFTVTASKSQAVNITDENAIPAKYLIAQPPKIDKAGIRKALKDGAVISGAELIENEGVRIR